MYLLVRREDNIKIYIGNGMGAWAVLTWLRVGTDGGLL